MSRDDVEPVLQLAFLGLGSNQGDRLAHLRGALFALACHPEIEVTAVSCVYETEYVGPGAQDPYLNACAAIRTSLAPPVLLAVLKGMEARHGRLRDGDLSPRPLDLDILVYGENVNGDGAPILPHPRLRERAFVLLPLREIAADLPLPDSGETVATVCARIRRQSGPWVRRLAGDLFAGNGVEP